MQKPDKEKEIREEKKAQEKLDKIYAYLHGGRYIPLQGDSRHFYDVETDKVVTLHSYPYYGMVKSDLILLKNKLFNGGLNE